MYQHQLDPSGRASILGTNKEDTFETVLKKHGLEYVRATRKTDPDFENAKNGHWDYRVAKTQKVDCKAAKRFHRWDESVQYDMVCLELHGGGWSGNTGWLQGKASAIAFEQINDWLLFDRAGLWKWIIHKMAAKGKPVINPSPEGIPENYKLYRRTTDKYEIVVWVPLADFLNEVQHFRLSK